MKVKDLIKKLESLNQDLEVVVKAGQNEFDFVTLNDEHINTIQGKTVTTIASSLNNSTLYECLPGSGENHLLALGKIGRVLKL
jgi:hypothetical protein